VRQSHAGSAVIGLLLVLVGGYYLLRNVLHVDVPTWTEAWPIILIVLGAAVIVWAARGNRGRGTR
jgi:uncharacterized integral membrane protein